MKTNNISKFRMFSGILIVILMIFATPTPVSESAVNESFARLIMSPYVESVVKPTVRKDQSMMVMLKLAAVVAVLIFHAVARRYLVVPLPAWTAFRPLIARRLIQLKLAPVKYTTLYPL